MCRVWCRFRKYIACILILSVVCVSGCSKKNGEEKISDEMTEQKEDETEPLALEKNKMEHEGDEEDVREKIVEEKSNTQSGIPKKDILIAIDPGHQSGQVDMSGLEENAPGSTVLKTQATGGTSGSYSGIPEYQLNMDISLALRDALQTQGYDVIMTREDNETAISNKQRAILANEAGADLVIRIHANGSENASANGALVLIGSAENPYVGNLYEDSYHAAEMVLNAYCLATGMVNRGVQTNDTMTGINWSTVPVLILEMGFMTNEQDDLNMADPAYRTKMVSGIVDGVNQYFMPDLSELEIQIQSIIQSAVNQNAGTAVYVEDIVSGANLSINNRMMQSASLIKLFVASCVYENFQIVEALETFSGETNELLQNMISKSDNDATNELICRLGRGDKSVGMEQINQFCQNHGFAETKIGRLMLDFRSEEDNYTSVNNCGLFLKELYQRQLPGSDEILEFMRNQERRSKIPAGISDNTMVANKTGELTDVENDVAIVFLDDRPYILCVMTDNLENTASGRDLIVQISSSVYSYMKQKQE